MSTDSMKLSNEWGWEGSLARRLRKKYSDKVILETLESPQLVCKCYECIERYLDPSKGFNRD